MDMCDPMDDFAPHKYTYEGQLYLLISGYEWPDKIVFLLQVWV
jgi:hypothetical protein